MNIQRLCALVTILGITALVLPPSAAAQSETLRASIPFEFYAADTLLPAGTYTIQAINNDVLQLRDSSGKAIFLMMNSREKNSALELNRLLFRLYGRTAFLAEVHWAGYATGRGANKTSREREIAQQHSDPQRIVVAGK